MNKRYVKTNKEFNFKYFSEYLDNQKSIGIVQSVIDGVVTILGLNNIKAGELIIVSNNIQAMALNLNYDNVSAVSFGDETLVKPGDFVEGTGNIVSVPTGLNLLGRVVNSLGEPIDGLKLESGNLKQVEIKAPGIITRKSVSEPMITGICIDAILNQKYENAKDIKNSLFCIYTAIGQKRSSISKLVQLLQKTYSLSYSIIVAATASEPAPLQFSAPYTGCVIGEYSRDNNKHALIIYDDLSKQAVAYRQMSLLLRRPPGREAYPGDIFYLHSRSSERAAKLNENF